VSARVAVVDGENRFVRWAERAEVHALRAPHRSAQVLLFDSKDRLVLARRHADKLTYPLHWDVSASGHVEESDYPDPDRPDDDLDAIYDAVAARELEEELGVRCPLTRLGAFSPLEGVHYEHLVLYLGRSDGPYVPQPDEVAEVKAFEGAALDALFLGGDRVTDSLKWFVLWARAQGVW
jgi:isopentenyldiphosphate isomerase